MVPQLTCSNKQSYVALWVGIDGYNDSTVEQTGVLGQCSHGMAVYSAWYEFYPSSPVYAPSSDVVKPGDFIYANVSYDASSQKFVTTLYDKNESWTYTSLATSVNGALRSSAEWILERPAIGGSLTTLANFGTAYYGEDYTFIQGTNYASIAGSTEPIAFFPYTQITMVTRGHSSVLASPSSVTSSGTSFYVTYG